MFCKQTENDIITEPPDIDELRVEEHIYDNKLDAHAIKDTAGKIEITSVNDEYDETNLPWSSERKTTNLKTEKPKIVRKKKILNLTPKTEIGEAYWKSRPSSWLITKISTALQLEVKSGIGACSQELLIWHLPVKSCCTVMDIVLWNWKCGMKCSCCKIS